MRKLDRSPSHSWWWNSHRSPKHSNWLESSLQELDEKVKEMLSLIEEDADSFAQRAEMYYQKRPELVNLVEEFYRAYRSLAERYDRLTGEIRQNIPRALQVQYGLSFRESSPNRGMVGPISGIYHQHSPLRKSQAFESLLRKAEEASPDRRDETKRVDSMEWLESTSREHDGRDETKRFDSMEWLESASREHDGTDHVSEGRTNGCSNHCIKSENKGKFLSEEGELTSSGSSDSEVDNITLPLEKLQEEIASLEKENKLIADSHKKVLELNEALQIKVEILEDQCRNIQKDAGALKDYNRRLLLAARTFGIQEVGMLVGRNPNSCVDVQGPCHEDQFAKDADVADGCGHDDEMQDDANTKDGVQNQYFMDSCGRGQLAEDISGDQFISLLEENWKQKQVILERGEEKREAIRQLCISMDMLKHENARLELRVSALKKRPHASRLGPFVGPTTSPLRFLPPLKKVLCFLGD